MAAPPETMPEKSPSGQHPDPAIHRPKDTGVDSIARLSRKTRKSPNKSGILFRGYGGDPPAQHSQDNCESQRNADQNTDRPTPTPPDGSKSRRKSEVQFKAQRAAQPDHLSRDDGRLWRAQSEIHDLERQLDAMKLQFVYLANLVHDMDSGILTSFFNAHGNIGMSRTEYLEADVELLESSALVENKSPMNNAS
ncbi:hypothetical protein TI39_contig464g00004 [Zymoseptoria brevis]|uniref:Uncharacterized protein n=1 Tax=Zymoseptoria brevis TaxID=1047168 RepID=A0A0F4GK03_9PEZI|nr:hypothetical protein TI39_contig464g00004 [Zymoseptoria brevis]